MHGDQREFQSRATTSINFFGEYTNFLDFVSSLPAGHKAFKDVKGFDLMDLRSKVENCSNVLPF